MPDEKAPTPALIPVGSPAPAFSLNDQKNKKHTLADYKGKFVVLYFYPKDDTPGCTKEACSFRDDVSQFKKRSAVVLGVSPDDEASHQKFIEKFSLPFDLLADTAQKTCNDYGVWQEKSMYGKKYMGVVRTTYLIGPDGKVAHRWDKVSVDGHQTEVLAKIDELKK
jgi:peroxiredoxin Q/BCP